MTCTDRPEPYETTLELAPPFHKHPSSGLNDVETSECIHTFCLSSLLRIAWLTSAGCWYIQAVRKSMFEGQRGTIIHPERCGVQLCRCGTTWQSSWVTRSQRGHRFTSRIIWAFSADSLSLFASPFPAATISAFMREVLSLGRVQSLSLWLLCFVKMNCKGQAAIWLEEELWRLVKSKHPGAHEPDVCFF